jgi:hypothetical protein
VNGATIGFEQEGAVTSPEALKTSHEPECLCIEGHESFGVELAEWDLEEVVAASIAPHAAMSEPEELTDAKPRVAHEQQGELKTAA